MKKFKKSFLIGKGQAIILGKKFLNFANNYRHALLVLTLFILVCFIPVKIPFPYFADLDLQVASQFLSTLVSILASMFAIAFAVIFIGFELVYKDYPTHVRRLFFTNTKCIEITILYISSIISGVISIAFLDDLTRSFNLIIFNIFLFIFCLLRLFPFTKSLITGVISTEMIKDLIKLLDTRRQHYLRSRITSPRILSGYLEEKENDPLFILGEAASNYLKDDNTIRACLIVVEVTKILLRKADGTPAIRRLLEGFIPFYRKVARQANKKGNKETIGVIFDMIEEIHSYCANKKVRWHEMIELNEMMESLIIACIRGGMEDLSRDALFMIPRIFERHLKKNSPRQENADLNNLIALPMKNRDYDAFNHWTHISEDYFYLQDKLTREAINENLVAAVTTGIHGFRLMTEHTLSATNLGDKQVRHILGLLSYIAQTLLIDCSKREFWNRMVKITPFETFTVFNCIKKNKSYSSILLLNGIKMYLKLLRNGKLSLFDLNKIGTVGRMCVGKIETTGDIFEKSALFIVNVFSYMREVLESDLAKERYKLYLEVYSQLESLMRFGEGKISKALKKKIENSLAKFAELDKVKSEMEKGVIEWPKDITRVFDEEYK